MILMYVGFFQLRKKNTKVTFPFKSIIQSTAWQIPDNSKYVTIICPLIY